MLDFEHKGIVWTIERLQVVSEAWSDVHGIENKDFESNESLTTHEDAYFETADIGDATGYWVSLICKNREISGNIDDDTIQAMRQLIDKELQSLNKKK